MAKTIVNKHFDDVNKIVREQFHDKEEYARGEILIVNGDEPSLWVLDKNNTPKQISGVNNGGGSADIDENIINEIISGYTAADSAITLAYQSADRELKSAYEAADDAIKKDYVTKINEVISGYTAKDTEISQALIDTESEILAHTVNGIAISENPVIDADVLSVGNYSEMIVTSPYENVTSLDTIQVAIKKVENMVIANALAFAAGLNDVNRKITELLERVEKLENQGSEELPEE